MNLRLPPPPEFLLQLPQTKVNHSWTAVGTATGHYYQLQLP